MNVPLPVILLTEILIAIRQIEALPRWKWNKSNRDWWDHDHSEVDNGCSVGQCVKEWNCPESAVIAEATGSCSYWSNGPWVCCDLNTVDRSHPVHGINSYSTYSPRSNKNPKQTATVKPNTRTSTVEYSNDNGIVNTPCVEDSWDKKVKERFPHVNPLGDILKNARKPFPTNRSQNKRTKFPSTINSKKTTSYVNNIKTTSSWNRPHTSVPRIIFPTEKPSTQKVARPHRTTSRPQTKKTTISRSTSKLWIWPAHSTTKSSWGDTRKTTSKPTKFPYSVRTTVTTTASAQGRKNQTRGNPTTTRPDRRQTKRPITNGPNFSHTARTTKRQVVTTPLPNVNTHLCGIRDQRRGTGRGKNHNYGRNPTISTSHSGSTSHFRGKMPYQRIVGGEEAEPFSWPWVAALYKVTSSGGNRFLSAGTLINKKFVLTAAHVFTPDDLRTASYVVMLGTHDAQDAVAEYAVSAVLVHPKYEHRYYYNDIALLKLERQVIFNNYIMPVCLPSPVAPLLRDRDLQGKNVTVMGWGDDSFGGKSSHVLREATFPIVSRVSCNASYVRVASNRFPKGITNNMLCAGDPNGGKDACQGDSGGPLTVMVNSRHTQVGIVSFGYKCGDKEFPGVYTKVAQYLSWIAENTENNDYQGYDY